MAEGLHAFIHARQGDVSLDEIMNAFILYERSPERFSGDFAGTVPTIV
jgi:hypothetical protein